MATQHQSDTTVLDRVETAKEAYRPPKFAVILHNDNFTPMEFVIYLLLEVFGKNVDDAVKLMLQVHNDGKGVCGEWGREVAESYVERVQELAAKAEYPLLCTLEEVKAQPDNKAGRSGPRPR